MMDGEFTDMSEEKEDILQRSAKRSKEDGGSWEKPNGMDKDGVGNMAAGGSKKSYKDLVLGIGRYPLERVDDWEKVRSRMTM